MGVLLEFSKAKLELFVALTVAKKPLQLQAKPAVKEKPTANDSLRAAQQLSACRQLRVVTSNSNVSEVLRYISLQDSRSLPP